MGESLPKANSDEHEVCGLCRYSFIPLTFENACVCKCGAMMGRTAITALQTQVAELENYKLAIGYLISKGEKHGIHSLKEAQQLVDKAIEIKSPWIDCKERLPTAEDSEWPDGDVLILTDGKNPETLSWEYITAVDGITHWRSIPYIPPTGDKG